VEVGQFAAAPFQTAGADPFGDGAALFLEEPVQRPDRDVVGVRDDRG
jgi:hypothetical protein